MKILTTIILCCSIVACSTTNRQTGCGATDVKFHTDSTQRFSTTLFSLISNSDDANVCVSPLSAQWALSMTANGAKGATAQQMYATLGYSGGEAIRDTFNCLQKTNIQAMRQSDEAEINIANSIWINENIKIKKSFIGTNQAYYDATVKNAPFDASTVDEINIWCKENTDGKINSIIDKLSPSGRMLLINALHFKAQWAQPFSKAATETETFTQADGSTVDVPMMKQSIYSPYYEDDTIQATFKNFERGEYTMLLVLPKENISMHEATEHLSKIYHNNFAKNEHCSISLQMPRFKNKFDTSLKMALMNMGMAGAFDTGADFSNISESPLAIDDVIQKCVIEVDETGAEAAAVTAVQMMLTSMRPQKKKTMTLNRPFIYAIINRASGNILFMGRVGNPLEE